MYIYIIIVWKTNIENEINTFKFNFKTLCNLHQGSQGFQPMPNKDLGRTYNIVINIRTNVTLSYFVRTLTTVFKIYQSTADYTAKK